MSCRAPLVALVFLAACAGQRARVPVIIDPAPESEPAAPLDEPPLASAAPPAPPAPLPEQTGAPAPASALAAEGFESMGERRGVKVYRRQKQPGVELAVDGILRAAPERVLRVLTDYPSHPRWQKRLAEQRVLARGAAFLDVYERLSLPVISDRDFTLHVTWGLDGEVAWMRFNTASAKALPPVPDAVRVTAHHGSWRLEPIEGGRATHAVYRFLIDLAGSVPMWLGVGQAIDELPDFFDSITRELPRYP